EALARANKHLENARNTQDQQRALKLCKDAKSALERINVPESIMDVDGIIATYREHGGMLKGLGCDSEADLSYKKAEELSEQYGKGAVDFPSTASANQPTSLSSADSTISSQSLELIPASIIAKDSDPHIFKDKLPKPDGRLDDTRQLAYCLFLLQDPGPLDDILDTETRVWLQTTRKNEDEQERLKTLARDLLREFAHEELMDETAVAEVILLAPALEKKYFRLLLGQFVNHFGSSILLNTSALDGLDYVVQSAPQGSIDADDLVKILKHLNLRLEDTHSESLDYIYRLTSVVSHILDAMALGGVQGLDRVSLHTPLTLSPSIRFKLNVGEISTVPTATHGNAAPPDPGANPPTRPTYAGLFRGPKTVLRTIHPHARYGHLMGTCRPLRARSDDVVVFDFPSDIPLPEIQQAAIEGLNSTSEVYSPRHDSPAHSSTTYKLINIVFAEDEAEAAAQENGLYLGGGHYFPIPTFDATFTHTRFIARNIPFSCSRQTDADHLCRIFDSCKDRSHLS
ncbi:hypothetical protein BGZ98_009915, partial [Dissophora globulifera]